MVKMTDRITMLRVFLLTLRGVTGYSRTNPRRKTAVILMKQAETSWGCSISLVTIMKYMKKYIITLRKTHGLNTEPKIYSGTM